MKVGIVGAGLLGTSLGLALRGHELWIQDSNATHQGLASDLMGASTEPFECDVVVVAVPVDSISKVVLEQIQQNLAPIVTDLGSIKTKPLLEVQGHLGSDAGKFVPGHPMAGREISGPAAARGDLFRGRPWFLTPSEGSDPARVAQVEELVRLTGATCVLMGPEEHDRLMAAISHAPQLLASLAASAVGDRGEDLKWAGQGFRDLTRIASSDPQLWSQILTSNAEAILPIWREIGALVASIDEALSAKDQKSIYSLIDKGRRARSQLPGKHGGLSTNYAVISVVVDDRPGQLGSLFAAASEFGINIEDLTLEHTPGHPTGVVEIAVDPTAVGGFIDFLLNAGWRAHSIR